MEHTHLKHLVNILQRRTIKNNRRPNAYPSIAFQHRLTTIQCLGANALAGNVSLIRVFRRNPETQMKVWLPPATSPLG